MLRSVVHIGFKRNDSHPMPKDASQRFHRREASRRAIPNAHDAVGVYGCLTGHLSHGETCESRGARLQETLHLPHDLMFWSFPLTPVAILRLEGLHRWRGEDLLSGGWGRGDDMDGHRLGFRSGS